MKDQLLLKLRNTINLYPISVCEFQVDICMRGRGQLNGILEQ
jgi:hypothetical protein